MDTFESKGVDYVEMVAIRSCLVNIRAFLCTPDLQKMQINHCTKGGEG